jgi:hypothetical protein
MEKLIRNLFLLFFTSTTFALQDQLESLRPITNTIKNVLILCPENHVSGGPEALCQLFYELHEYGINVNIL